ncbi:FAD-dependent oxidoreductase [Kutzneria viridogrisea]|uniref:2-polyprenyl-6-methoxyphenol hydroxylase-like FAD-dependent oxidoreductase n=1 Tax=Kutzneria viridogrisea TaxID=47990 RepID=A0ABR6BIF3_9PSEU|nr:2-polyprenyl-6-methoxyphenol hydroxylase-like FAD-dependent oxidoreductase [Kutzneria viridogrisea]
MEVIQTDVCVVGGGPAGLTLALLLARSGVDVVLAERMRSFDREYRGEILQPSAQLALAEIGVLDAVLARGAYPMRSFQLATPDKVLLDIDYRRLPAPHNHLLSVPQRHVLESLHEACAATPGFRQLDGSSANQVLSQDGRVVGIRCGTGESEREVRARWVVAADGRYSKTRQLAGIDYRRVDTFQHDIAWLKLKVPGFRSEVVQIHRNGEHVSLIHDSYPDQVQVGLLVPHGRYRELSQQGIDHVKSLLCKAVPQFAGEITDQVHKLGDLTLLDVFSGRASEWVRDGLVLIGDCAHTHSPIGAQGVNLAIADAVELHPALVEALRADTSSASALAEFAQRRQRAVESVFSLQARQSRAMLSDGKVINALRPVLAKVLPHTPIFGKVLRTIAYGAVPTRPRTDLFAPVA